MNSLPRIKATIFLELPDRPPVFGGWLVAQEDIQILTGCFEQAYWEEPFFEGVQVEKMLGSDGVVDIFEPISKAEYRVLDHNYLHKQQAVSVESFLAWIDTPPDEDELIKQFDVKDQYCQFKERLFKIKTDLDDIVWVATDWEAIFNVLGHWLFHFGIGITMVAMALHPARFHKLIRNGAITDCQEAKLYVKAVREPNSPGNLYGRGFMFAARSDSITRIFT